MNGRERIRRVLRRDLPDSVPRALYDVAISHYNDTTLELFREKTGKHPRDCFRHDIEGVFVRPRDMAPEWRQRLRAATSGEEIHTLMQEWRPTRATVEELRRAVDEVHSRGRAALVVGSASDFETPFGLRGREQFFMDLGYEPDWLVSFLDAVTDAAASDAELAARAGADIFGIGDDLGSQRGLLISPAQWRRLFKPRLQRIVKAVKRANIDAAFFLHTDGNVEVVIPDFIEVGVEVLNPIQPEVMDPARIKAQFGADLVFLGAISVQHTLPLGTPQDVYDEVRLRLSTIGAGGGYIMTPSHLLNADIPWDNIVAFFEAADRFGTYR